MRYQMAGYTLMELLLTVALISVLAMMATLTYRGPSIRAKQAHAKTGLFGLATVLERCYLENHSYRACTVSINSVPGYRLKVVKQTDDGFELAAIPEHQDKDDSCGSFYLDQDGNKRVSGKSTTCW